MSTTKNSSARGRPRGFDVDNAIAIAMRLFHARGYDAVGVAEIGAALGIKPPSFYAAFGSKAGLFAQVLERYAAGDANVFATALAGGGDVATVIARTLAIAARHYPEKGGTAGCLVLDGARNSADPEARALAHAARVRSRAQLRDFIAGDYPAQADALADLVVLALEGMSAAARDGADVARLDVFAVAIARAFRTEAAQRE